MANIYVSQTATNGYGVGDDARNRATAGNKETPVLTVDRAIALSQSGDEIVINDGTYPATSSTFYQINKDIILKPENAQQVTLTCTSSARLFNITGNVSVFTVEDIILDGLGNPTGIVSIAGILTQTAITLNRCALRNADWYGIYQQTLGISFDLVVNDCDMGAAERGFMYIRGIEAGSVTIDGLELAIPDVLSNQAPGMRIDGAVGNTSTCSIKNVTGDVTLNSGAGSLVHWVVQVNNIQNALIEDCDVDIHYAGGNTPSGGLYNIRTSDTNGSPSHGGRIINCSGQNDTTGGYTALIGTDNSNVATDNQSNNSLISGGTMTCSAITFNGHGPMVGHQTDCCIENITTDQCDVGACGLLKGCTTTVSSGNIGDRVGSSFCYQKGSTDCLHTNNTCIVRGGFNGTPELANYDDTSTPNKQGTNSTFSNNVVTGDTVPQNMAQSGTSNSGGADTTSGTTFSKTHYDTTLGGTSFWRDGDSTTYNNITDFNNSALVPAGEEAVNTALNLNANNSFNQGSPFLAIGVKKWGNNPRPDTQGEPLPDTDIDLGHNQSSFSPNHPSNL